MTGELLVQGGNLGTESGLRLTGSVARGRKPRIESLTMPGSSRFAQDRCAAQGSDAYWSEMTAGRRRLCGLLQSLGREPFSRPELYRTRKPCFRVRRGAATTWSLAHDGGKERDTPLARCRCAGERLLEQRLARRRRSARGGAGVRRFRVPPRLPGVRMGRRPGRQRRGKAAPHPVTGLLEHATGNGWFPSAPPASWQRPSPMPGCIWPKAPDITYPDEPRDGVADPLVAFLASQADPGASRCPCE